MGGMIAQELVGIPIPRMHTLADLNCSQALLIPNRVASLSLVASAPYIFNTVGYVQNLRNRINLLWVSLCVDTRLVC